VIKLDTKGLATRGVPPVVPVLWDRRGGELVPLEAHIDIWRFLPERRAGTARALAIASFIDLVNRHKDDHSAIFANTDWKAPSFVAVIDYHQTGGEARNLGHRITYDFPLTDEWRAWRGQDLVVMDQGEFAAFIEERIAELSSPAEAERGEFERLFQSKFATPAELIQLSRGLQVKVGVNVKQARTLQSGESEVVFEESHHDAAGNKLIVPGLFMLSVPVFFRGHPVRLPARLRYRAGSSIKWVYQLYRPDIFVGGRIEGEMEHVRKATGLPVYEGAPEVAD
jgi:uncharacterized protein YfdQ (DUF2303 family)